MPRDTPYFLSNSSKHIDEDYCQVSLYFNKNKRFYEVGMLGPTKLKVINYRGNLEIRDFKYPKTKH